MRKATMFTIERNDVMATDRYSYFMMSKLPDFNDFIDAGPDVLVMTDSQRIDVPVHHVRKVEYGHQTDNYIAMSPELQEILEAPFERRVFELKQEVWKTEAWAKQCLGRQQAAEDLIAAYNDLPWYKRIFRKVRYPLPNYHD